MTYSQVRIDVADYTKWRASFEASAAPRRTLGATGNNEIFRDRDNPNTVTVILEWEDAERANQYSQSPALKDLQQKAGVTKVHETRLLDRG